MKSISSFIILIFLVVQTSGNNISIDSVTLTGQNTSAGVNNAANFALVQFNVSWENSWRMSVGPSNWDAVWLFVKYRVNGAGDWHHANLNNTGHASPAGTTIDAGLLTPGSAFNLTTNPGIGVFLYRNTDGSGTLTANNVQLRWNYGSQGINDNFPIEVQVFGVEMVYIPTGAFNVGGGGGMNSFTSTTINTASALTVPTGIGNLGGQAGGYPTGQTAPSNATWPNGYSAFYCMKNEISQKQYVDFLNSLTRSQQGARVSSSISGTSVSLRWVMSGSGNSVAEERNSIRVNATIPAAPIPINFYCDLNANGNPNENSDGQWIACNDLRWNDFASYLDWSGLRPMTELEYEKTCRGNLPAVPGEFAWGNTNIIGASGINSSGYSDESASNNNTNIVYNDNPNIQGPLRVGCFSFSYTNREQAGAAFYGVTEMSGNLSELVISIGVPEGRLFTGIHGDGLLTASGDSNVNLWPSTNGIGAGLRGGDFSENSSTVMVSDRKLINDLNISSGQIENGGRGVRTAP